MNQNKAIKYYSKVRNNKINNLMCTTSLRGSDEVSFIDKLRMFKKKKK